MPFTARYVFSLEDYKSLRNAVGRHGRFLPWPVNRRMIGLFILLCIPVLIEAAGGKPGQAAVDAIPLVILFSATVLVFRSSPFQRMLFRQCSIAGQSMTYEIGENGASWMGAHMRGKSGWPAIERLTVTLDAAVLLTNRNEGMVLPARAFASGQEFEAAVSFIRANVPAKKTAPTPGQEKTSSEGNTMQEQGSAKFAAGYVFSFEDYLSLHRAVRPESQSQAWRFLKPLLIVLLLVMLVTPVLEAIQKGPVQAFLDWVAGIWPVALLLAAFLLVTRSSLFQRLFYLRCSCAGEALRYGLHAESVSWVKECTQGECDWQAIRSIAVTPAAAVLMLGKSEGVVLPARAFASQAEFEAAVSFARAKVTPENAVPAA